MTFAVEYDLPEADYFADPALSQSGAKLLLPPSCPAKFKHGDRRTSAAFDFGHVAHSLILGNGDRIAIVEAEDWRSKAARDAKANAYANDLYPILQADYNTALLMVDAIEKDAIAAALFRGGKAEVSLFWEDEETGVPCKARLDYLPEIKAGRRLIVGDLKTAIKGDPEAFGKAAQTNGYFIQDAWYRSGIKACGLDDDPAFVFVAQEKSPPFVVSTYQLDQDGRQIGEHYMRKALHLFAACSELDRWPTYTNGEVHALGLPLWFVRNNEEALA